MKKQIKILDKHDIENKIRRLAWEIYENNDKEQEIVIVGIQSRGFLIARLLSKHLLSISNITITLASLKLNKESPNDNSVELDIDISKCTDKVIVLCDDVLQSGKTLIYATKYFLNTSLARISTVVLINRNHNTYPIKSDYVGLSLATTLQQYVSVVLEGSDQGVYLS